MSQSQRLITQIKRSYRDNIMTRHILHLFAI